MSDREKDHHKGSSERFPWGLKVAWIVLFVWIFYYLNRWFLPELIGRP